MKEFNNASELIEVLQAHKPVSSALCTNCGADKSKPSWNELIEVVGNCNNCQVDIYLFGDWSGYGWEYLVALAKIDQDLRKWEVVYKYFFRKDNE